MFDYEKRRDLEKAEGWDDIVSRIPPIPFKEGWKVSVIPPFRGAVVRFCVTLPCGTEKSVYLDFFDNLGYVGKPYWEVYPAYDDDACRCLLNEVDKLLDLIEYVEKRE